MTKAQCYKYLAIKKLDDGELNENAKLFIEKIRYYTKDKLWNMTTKQYYYLKDIAEGKVGVNPVANLNGVNPVAKVSCRQDDASILSLKNK